jgi:hypothetical protein
MHTLCKCRIFGLVGRDILCLTSVFFTSAEPSTAYYLNNGQSSSVRCHDEGSGSSRSNVREVNEFQLSWLSGVVVIVFLFVNYWYEVHAYTHTRISTNRYNYYVYHEVYRIYYSFWQTIRARERQISGLWMYEIDVKQKLQSQCPRFILNIIEILRYFLDFILFFHRSVMNLLTLFYGEMNSRGAFVMKLMMKFTKVSFGRDTWKYVVHYSVCTEVD